MTAGLERRPRVLAPAAPPAAVAREDAFQYLAPAPGRPPPKVSVVIPTCQRDALLRRCLHQVVKQKAAETDFEVIVVDDARSSSTPGIIEDFRRRSNVPVYLLPGRGKGPAAARNAGWRAAVAEIIAFLDDDAYPADDRWLAESVAELEGSQAAGVSGPVRVPVDYPPTDFQRNVKKLEQAEFVTCNAFYRRPVLEEAGGFDARFEAPFREDSDLQFRIEAAGGLLVRSRKGAVIHPAQRGRFGASLALQRYSMYNALIYKKHPRRFRQKLQPVPPLHYYAILLLQAATPLAFVLGAPVLAFGCLVAWAALQLGFFLRRVRGTSLAPRHLLDMVITSLLIPPLAAYWRLRGAIRYRVLFI